MKHALELAQRARPDRRNRSRGGQRQIAAGYEFKAQLTEGLATLDRTRVGHARVAVTDAGGEEFDEAAAGAPGPWLRST
jgi:hypothetical protein